MLIRLVTSNDEKDKQGMAQNGCSTLSLCPPSVKEGRGPTTLDILCFLLTFINKLKYFNVTKAPWSWGLVVAY